MTSMAALKDVEDKYFECSVCLENFKEPKLLPCLHRFCKKCLERIIKEHNGGEFKCPLCNELCDIPPEGVDGFRTDFHMKSMLEYIQLKQTAKTEDLTAECGGCSKESKVISYCFKCKGFLCEQCSSIHLTLKMMKDHKMSILSLKEIREQKLSLERLASLTETPRCQNHVEKPAEVCCWTCQNLPICMVCAHVGEHKAHVIHDVKNVAEKERLRVETTMGTLEECRENVDQLPIRVEKVKENLSEDISSKKEELNSQHANLSEKFGLRLKTNEEILERNKAEINDLEKEAEVAGLEEERKASVEKINDKFDKLIGEKRAKNQDLREGQIKLHDARGGRINKGIVLVDEEYKELDSSVDQQGIDRREKLNGVFDEAANRRTRYYNFWSVSSSILASKDEWTEAHCLPEITKEISDSLIQEVRKDFPKLESLGHIDAGDLNTIVGGMVRITEEPESVVDIGIKAKGWNAMHMKSSDSGYLFVTGDVDNEHMHITVIDREGKLISTDQINRRKRDNFFPKCSPLTLFRLVTACQYGSILLFNTQNRSPIREHITDHRLVYSVATDQIKNNVYIGTDSRDVFVLDDMLKHHHTLQLPRGVQSSYDMVIHDDNLLVCDNVSKRAYIVTREGPEAELVCELPTPDHMGGDWQPYRVCTDSNGWVYILWLGKILGQRRCILTQYSSDGHHLLSTRDMEGRIFGMDTVLTDGSEKLLLVTFEGMLYTYGLISLFSQ